MIDAPFFVAVNLADAITKPRLPIVAAGSEVMSISVISAPAGFSATVQLGAQGGTEVPLPPAGMGLKLCPAVIGGIFLTSPVGASGTLYLGINIEMFGAPSVLAVVAARCIGSSRTNGSVNGAPVDQLQNPSGSGKVYRVIHAYATGPADTCKFFESTAANLNGAGATIVTGVSRFMDTRRSGTPTGICKGSNFAANYFGFNTQPGQIILPTNNNQVDLLLGKGDWYLAENKVLEAQWTVNGAGNIGAVTWIWEEL